MNKPKNILENFLLDWKEQKWNYMVQNCLHSWKNMQYNALEMITGWFKIKELLEFEIIEEYFISDVFVRIKTRIKYKSVLGKILDKYITAFLIKEESEYVNSPIGTWRISPISLLREEDIKNGKDQS